MTLHTETPIDEKERRGMGRKIRHALAVVVAYFRRPGRFSLCHYSRESAFERLKNAKGLHVLDLGSSTFKVADHVIAVDLSCKKGVDVVADVCRLPFGNNTCDGIWMGGLLEHVPDPSGLILECHRVLKRVGWVYCETPFLYGEHNAPGDYHRWTRQGLKRLFQDWEIEWVTDVTGVFSALACQLRVCLSLLTSFGSDLLYRIMHEAVWSYVVWPIKHLDACFRWHPQAKAHAAGYGIMARKT
mgnify:CR=1 FL=1